MPSMVAAVLFTWSLAPLLVSAAQLPNAPEIPAVELERIEPSVRAQIGAALAEARNNPDARTLGRLGAVLYAYDQHDRAATCFARARDLEPSEVRWSYYLGLAHAATGRTAEAIANLRDALRLDPHYLPTRVKLGDLLLDMGTASEAVRIYDESVRQQPQSALARYGLGRAQAALGDTDAALVSYQRAIDLAPDFGAAHYALALLYRDRNELEKSRAHLAQYRSNQARRPALLDPLADAIEAHKGGPYHLLEEGRRLEKAGRHQEAAAMLEKVLELRGDLVEARVSLIAAYGALSDFDKAETHFRRAVEQRSDVVEAHYNFGLTLLARQRFGEAAEAFERALAIAPWYADAHNNLGYVLLRQQRAEDAVAHFRAALATNPQHRDAHFNLAQVLQRAGRHPEAIEHLLQATMVDDNRTALFVFYLADAYARAGKPDQALRYALDARARAHSAGPPELLPHIDRLIAAVKGSNPR